MWPMGSKTLVYTPRVEAYVALSDGRIIDLSKDIVDGSIGRQVNAVSTASLTLNNRGGRYTNLIKVMDRIRIVLYKGSKAYPVFTGYVTSTPVYAAFAQQCTIEAQCTIKRLMHVYWDPRSNEAIEEFIVQRRPLSKIKVSYPTAGSTAANTGAGDGSGSVAVVGTAEQQKLINFALSLQGKWYYTNDNSKRMNPEKSGGTDCSGFVGYCYRKLFNINPGVRSADFANTGMTVTSGGNVASLQESLLQPGDVVVYDWVGGFNRYEHVEMYIGGGRMIGHGSGQGPKLSKFPLAWKGTVKYTVRRYLQVQGAATASSQNVGAAVASAASAGLEAGQGGQNQETEPFDAREDYFAQQGADGMSGIRLKGFLEKVCGWDMDTVKIEATPDRLVRMVSGLGIKEGAQDADVEIQRVYRMLMGDTFASNQAESEQVNATAEDPAGGFTGAEGRGDTTYTKTMYGIAKAVSGINYSATSSKFVQQGKGTGAYGLPDMKGKSKDEQDAKMLSVLKQYVKDGTKKTVSALADRYAKGLPGVERAVFVAAVIAHAAKAPMPTSLASASKGTAKAAANAAASGAGQATVGQAVANAAVAGASGGSATSSSQVDLYLKGLREMESNNNYTAKARGSSATGAYQYITSTWGGYGGYRQAYLAPPAVQDEKARKDSLAAFAKYGDWEKVAAHHIYPAWASDKSKWSRRPPGNNPITIRQYVDRVCKYITNRTDGGDMSGAADGAAAAGGSGEDWGQTFDQAFAAFFKSTQYGPLVADLESTMLTGEKALMNDEPALKFVQALTSGSMRSFMSDPDGNFVAFYPDYFGTYKSSSSENLVKIQAVELKDFNIQATDKIFTHVYILDSSLYPDMYGLGQLGGANQLDSKYYAGGVVTMENTQLMNQLLGMSDDETSAFLAKYGGRPVVEQQDKITNKTFAKVYAIELFLRRWAEQYSTPVDFTFMPELWPGNRAEIADTGIAVYVENVTHRFSYTSGFTTSATISCPQRLRSGAAPEALLPKGVG